LHINQSVHQNDSALLKIMVGRMYKTYGVRNIYVYRQARYSHI